MTGDTLALNVDPAMLGDTVTGSNMIMLEVENIHPITITVPRGMLKSVDNRSEALYMTGFAVPRLDASMGSSRIKRMIRTMKFRSISEMKLRLRP